MLAEKLDKYQTVFQNGLEDAILKMVAKVPIHPPNGAVRAGHFTAKATNILGMPAPQADDRGHVKFSKQKLVNLADQVAFAKFKVENTAGEKGALSFDVLYPDELATGSRAGHLPIWWLPWNGVGSLVKLVITPSTTPTLNFGGTLGTTPNPHIFFTAAINGCSVFVRGSDAGPSVWHAGLTGDVEKAIGPDNFQRLGGTSENVWRKLMEGAQYGSGGTGNVIQPKARTDDWRAGKGTFGEVNRSQYISERTWTGSYLTTWDYTSGKNMPTTTQASALQSSLNKNTAGKGYSLSPWGCVFGIRSGGSWKFYLQRNATVVWGDAKWERESYLSVFPTLKPTGMAQVSVVTIGYEQFFAGEGVAHYRELNSVKFY